ncbi:FMN-binding negative transcriptional regulator [Paracoccus aerodenitrificans]|uniref:FMN-binding negative transcriptional regulator n=1 Tax=Paracoccus aerodenitrificans TaxID=3017781 RepID=UPI0022F089F6|nr:FMN-binding negative transcriptional regulator [Paracoccus aerodenitrificans]WBU64517.1 FMN-binding negative transcriptional regulator [Paracoccus aerodenitrificans]
MYCPPAFAETRPEVLKALIRSNPLGLLITAGPSGPVANPVPFQLGPDGVLRAHLARANPQLGELEAASDVLVVFQGEQSYISPGWYATKKETGKVVPTWNYLMVQARGQARLTSDAEWLRAQIGALTDLMEHDRSEPWEVSDAPESFIASQLRGIVGLEIGVTDVRGKWKAGQNRSQPDRDGVAQALGATHPGLSVAAMGDS